MNQFVYNHWKVRPPQEVLIRHRQVQGDELTVPRGAPDARFNDKKRRAEKPYDLNCHSADARVKDINKALNRSTSIATME